MTKGLSVAARAIKLARKLQSSAATMVTRVEQAQLDELAGMLEHPGDKVTVELSPYDLTRGRITYRAR